MAAALTPSPLRVLSFHAGWIGLMVLAGFATAVLLTWVEAAAYSFEVSDGHARVDLRRLNGRMPQHFL